MNTVRRITLAFLVILVAVAAGALPAETNKPTVHRVSLAEIGKEGSGTHFVTDEALTARILGKGSRLQPKTQDITPAPTLPPTFALSNGAIVEETQGKYLNFVGTLTTDDILVATLASPNSQDSLPLFSISFDQNGDWFVSCWQGDGTNTLSLRLFLFNKKTGAFSVLTSAIDFYGSPSLQDGGIGQPYVKNGVMTIEGRFYNAHVRINYTQVPDNYLVYTSDGLEVHGYNPMTGTRFWGQGNNLVTVTSRNGQNDTSTMKFTDQ